MKVVLSGGGYEVAKEGAVLRCRKRGTVAPMIAMAVSFGVTLIVLVNFAVWMALGRAEVARILAAVAFVSFLVFRGAMGAYRRARDTPSGDLPLLLEADLEAGELRDANGARLAALGDVTMDSGYQFTSSARSLTVRWPGGSRAIFQGDLFGGGIPEAKKKLAAAGWDAA